MRIDAHQHFWHYSPIEHTWMSDAMEILKRDYLPEDLQPLLSSLHFDGCIAVQVRQSLEETRWLLELAERYDFIRGVVGWLDLRSPELPDQLERFAHHPKLVGVRHVVQDEPDEAFMLRPEFRQGIAQLQRYDLVYDLLLFPKHLPFASKLVAEFPNQQFILDHIAKPPIADGQLSPWREDLRELATYPNVACKLSGMVTEAKWGQWQPKEFHPYLDIVFKAFGADRLMIGSDWPVCLLSGNYRSTMQIVMEYVQRLSIEAQQAILGDNCARLYRIKPRSS
jgi:L-fuconolactonase